MHAWHERAEEIASMNGSPIGKFAVTSVAIAVVVGLGTGARADTQQAERASDVWIEATIFTSYLLNDSLSALDIDIGVDDGIVELSGEVDNAIQKDLANEIAEAVDGVKMVNNRLKVAGDEAVDRSAERSTDAFVRLVGNASTSARVKSRLLWNSHTRGLAIDVDSDDGVVELTGTVRSEAVRDLAGALALNTTGVHDVNNRLRVDGVEKSAEMDERSDRGALDAAGAAVRDAWITAKVEATLLFDKRANDFDIDVSTQEGVVTLEGEVPSAAAERAVVSLVGDVVGVKKVRSDLDTRA
jgi:osmotically-inducible protein OsmY